MSFLFGILKRAAAFRPYLNYQAFDAFHTITPPSSLLSPLTQRLLVPQSPFFIPTCGFKVHYKPKRRCKDCFVIIKDKRKYILCPTHGRHKQMSMMKRPKHYWQLTHAFQCKDRGY